METVVLRLNREDSSIVETQAYRLNPPPPIKSEKKKTIEITRFWRYENKIFKHKTIGQIKKEEIRFK